jgi:hypothetical protein
MLQGSDSLVRASSCYNIKYNSVSSVFGSRKIKVRYVRGGNLLDRKVEVLGTHAQSHFNNRSKNIDRQFPNVKCCTVSVRNDVFGLYFSRLYGFQFIRVQSEVLRLSSIL